MTPEQLQKYWNENPDALAQALAANPGMFGQDITGGTPTLQLTEKLTPLELLRQENLAHNAANPLPEGFDPASLSNTGGVPLWQMGGGFGPADRQASRALNKLFANPSQDFNEYVTSGTQHVQEFRTNNFNLGGVSLISTDGTITSTLGTFSPEVQQTVIQELNQQEQAYTDGMIAFFNNEPGAAFPTRPDPYSIFEKYGLPRETTGADGGLLKLNPVTGQYEGAKRPKDDFMGKLVKNAPAIIGAATGNPWLAAAGSGFVAARDGGNLEDILRAGAAAGAGSFLGGGALAKVPGLNAANVPSSFLRGATTSAVTQAIANGEISFEDAVKAGLINVGVDVVKDTFGDARQTNDGNLRDGVDTYIDANGNTQIINSVDGSLDRLTNSTDLYGTLGENGLLSKLGLDVGNMPTDWIGDGLDLFGFGGRPIVDPTGSNRDAADAADKATMEYHDAKAAELRAEYANGTGDMTNTEYMTKLGELGRETNLMFRDTQDMFLNNTARTDIRFFDMFEPHGDSRLTGIVEGNPFKNTSVFTNPFSNSPSASPAPITTGVGENVLPGSGDIFTPTTDAAFNAYMDRNPTASIGEDVLPPNATEDTYVSENDLLGTDPAESDLNYNGEGDLPTAGEEDVLPTADKEDVLPTADKEDVLPTADKEDVLPPSPPDRPPPTTGGGGGGGGGSSQQIIEKFDADNAENLYRLARIIQIEGVPADMKAAASQRLQELLGQREKLFAEGDITGGVDEQSSAYIQKIDKEKEAIARRNRLLEEDPLQAALEDLA